MEPALVKYNFNEVEYYQDWKDKRIVSAILPLQYAHPDASNVPIKE